MASNVTAKSPGERLAGFFENFFKSIIGVSTLGSSITFSVIVSPPTTMAAPLTHGIDASTVRQLIAIAWLFFLIDLALTSFAASALTLYRPQAVAYFGVEETASRRIVMWWATAVSFVLFAFLIIAFLLLGLVVVAHAGAVGWASIVMTAAFGMLGLVVIVVQSPLCSKRIGVPYGRTMTTTTKIVPPKDPPLMGFGPALAPQQRPAVAEVPAYTLEMRRYRKEHDGDGLDEREV